MHAGLPCDARVFGQLGESLQRVTGDSGHSAWLGVPPPLADDGFPWCEIPISHRLMAPACYAPDAEHEIHGIA